VSSVNLRHSVRAVVLDEGDRILLCRFTIPKPTGTAVVWAALQAVYGASSPR
jgi:hypothetical protein